MSEEIQENAAPPRRSWLASWLWKKARRRTGLRALVDRLPWKQRFAVLIVWNASVLGIAGVVVAFLYFTAFLPHPMKASVKRGTPVIRIVDNKGVVLSQRGKRHPYMPLSLLPKHVLEAVVAIEDRRFYTHWGIDPAGIFRALLVNLRADGYRQGGSTLTQQLAKNLYLTPKRTVMRKIEESLIALWLEFRLSKADILELYLNRVYFGAGAYGIESAAQKYFSKSARELLLPEAALLAGLLKAPSNYAPVSNPGKARTRARTVLAKMRDAGLISSKAAEAGIRASLKFADFRPRRHVSGVEYAIDYIYERLPQLSGLEQSEIIVETTIDATVQEAAQRIVTERLRAAGGKGLQGALLIMDTDGGIAAMVGGRSYKESQFNRATQALRQPGSAFKPIVYLAALEAGLSPDSPVTDMPIEIGNWRPRNHDDRYIGQTTLEEALVTSRNTASVRVFQHAGSDHVRETAKRLGVVTKLHGDPSLALGTGEVRLSELTGVYAQFANGGQRVRPHVIRQVRMSSGRIVYARRSPQYGTVIAERNIHGINTMLRAVVMRGTGKRAALVRHPTAGKTGTTQGSRDAWFMGYTAHYAGGVWIGTDNAENVKNITGGSLPAEIWRDVMQVAHAHKRPRPLPQLDLQPDARDMRALPPTKLTAAAPLRVPPLPFRRPDVRREQENVVRSATRVDQIRQGTFATTDMMGLGGRR